MSNTLDTKFKDPAIKYISIGLNACRYSEMARGLVDSKGGLALLMSRRELHELKPFFASKGCPSSHTTYPKWYLFFISVPLTLTQSIPE